MITLLRIALLLLCTSHGIAVQVAFPRLQLNDLFNVRRNDAVEPVATCGYSSCPSVEAKKINVHIVAHSHDDVGWLKTVDQYYYGTKKRYNTVGVQFILDSVIPELVMDPTKRFIYVEMSFFSKWWQEQSQPMKDVVKRLVNEGRLEFINGGWCMNDEATVTYQSTIEQMTLGLKFLNETFGRCGRPKVGWQIDPFGHSSEQASLFAQFGFDGMFFTRIRAEDKHHRTENKSLDIIWHGDRLLSGQSGSIFTNIFRDGYDAPSGFCFDAICLDDNLVDNKNSYEYNIDWKGQEFILFIKNYANSKLTNHILIPMGGDFQYSAAGQNFKNLDKLIKYVRENAPNINIFYSTPSCYQYALYQASRQHSIRFPEKFDDFMPYDSSPTVWWSGYFSSRPSVKLVERQVANLMQVSRLISLASLLKTQQDKRNWPNEVKIHEASCLLPLWEILGDLQHHDAVTGTEKQHVADDYVRRASAASNQCVKFIGDIRRAKINEYLKKSPKYEQLRESGKKFKLDPVYLEETALCPLLNISQCDPVESEVDERRYLHILQHNTTFPYVNSVFRSGRVRRSASATQSRANGPTPELKTKSVLLTIYNPLARPISQHDVRVPCNGRCDLDAVHIIHLSTNETMRLIRLPLPSGVLNLPFRDAQTTYEVLFYANIPALGHTSFVIEDNNIEDAVEEESDISDSIVVTDEQEAKRTILGRRIRNPKQFAYYPMSGDRYRRDLNTQQPIADKVIVKFDMGAGMIVGLKRVSDGSTLNITQKFGYYYPSNFGAQPGAYIFRPNTSEPFILSKPTSYKIYKRKSGALIEIHQKWANWLWQTIRVDAKKSYIEFDYVVGPIPTTGGMGREVVTRYITNMSNNGVFLTDSNSRQLLARRRLTSTRAEDLGGSFYPVVSTIILKNNNVSSTRCGTKCSAEAVAILVDRAQAGTSLSEGQIELLIHRRQLRDDNFGVAEALDEPGEDGRGLVSRGRHRLYLKFHETSDPLAVKAKAKPQLFRMPETPRANLEYEKAASNRFKVGGQSSGGPTFIAHDPIFNDVRQESIKFALKPTLTFDRLRVTATELVDMVASDGTLKVKTDLTLLNNTLPINVNLLTLQPWSSGNNELLIRLENTDNPLTIHPYPFVNAYDTLVNTYKTTADYYELETNDNCAERLRARTEVDLEFLIKRIRIVSLRELNLGAHVDAQEAERLDWTDEGYASDGCDIVREPAYVKLAPRQIRTFLAKFEFL